MLGHADAEEFVRFAVGPTVARIGVGVRDASERFADEDHAQQERRNCGDVERDAEGASHKGSLTRGRRKERGWLARGGEDCVLFMFYS